jgi:mono/diheme cytochrome c family protein
MYMKLSVALALCASASAATPTFNDIAPILYHNCASCHRPGEVAPFSLLTYDDAAKRASLIATVTAKRYMPPWKPEPGAGHFADERRLTDSEIALLADWAKAGAPQGDPKHAPAAPRFAAGWLAGKPDAEVRMPEPFTVPADGRDVFQCFVVPLPFDGERYVKTVEFHPGNRKVVHHALFFLDTSGEARKLDSSTPEPGYPCFGGPRVPITGGLGGWAPGATPSPLPDGVAHTIPKAADLVVQIHYHPSGKPESDQSALGLTFAGAAPSKGLANLLVGPRRIDLPPGEVTAVTDWAVVPEDSELIGITPHAHWLAKQMKVDAHLPDGKVEPLIRIDDWDFNWQGQYRYESPVKLPKGTRIEMRYTYDNTAQNPRNPSNPPRRVRFGEQTTDEMAFVFLQFALADPAGARDFRRAVTFSRLERILESGDFSELPRGQASMLRLAIARFDRNGNGKLDPEERTALLQFLRTQIR